MQKNSKLNTVLLVIIIIIGALCLWQLMKQKNTADESVVTPIGQTQTKDNANQPDYQPNPIPKPEDPKIAFLKGIVTLHPFSSIRECTLAANGGTETTYQVYLDARDNTSKTELYNDDQKWATCSNFTPLGPKPEYGTSVPDGCHVAFGTCSLIYFPEDSYLEGQAAVDVYNLK